MSPLISTDADRMMERYGPVNKRFCLPGDLDLARKLGLFVIAAEFIDGDFDADLHSGFIGFGWLKNFVSPQKYAGLSGGRWVAGAVPAETRIDTNRARISMDGIRRSKGRKAKGWDVGNTKRANSPASLRSLGEWLQIKAA